MAAAFRATVGSAPSTTAPTPYSGWPGAPILRTISTSSGASSARATAAATGTPPRGRATTRVPGPASSASARPRRRPASARSRNGGSDMRRLLCIGRGQTPNGQVSRAPARGASGGAASGAETGRVASNQTQASYWRDGAASA